MNKIIKYTSWFFVLIISLMWLVYAAWNLTSVWQLANDWDFVTKDWFNEVSNTLWWTKVNWKLCAFNWWKISCVNDVPVNNFWTLQEGKWCKYNWGKISCINDLPSLPPSSSWSMDTFFSSPQTFIAGEWKVVNLGKFAFCWLSGMSNEHAPKYSNGWQYRWSCWVKHNGTEWILTSVYRWTCTATCFWWTWPTVPPPSTPPVCVDQWTNYCCDWLTGTDHFECMNEIPF